MTDLITFTAVFIGISNCQLNDRFRGLGTLRWSEKVDLAQIFASPPRRVEPAFRIHAPIELSLLAFYFSADSPKTPRDIPGTAQKDSQSSPRPSEWFCSGNTWLVSQHFLFGVRTADGTILFFRRPALRPSSGWLGMATARLSCRYGTRPAKTNMLLKVLFAAAKPRAASLFMISRGRGLTLRSRHTVSAMKKSVTTPSSSSQGTRSTDSAASSARTRPQNSSSMRRRQTASGISHHP